MIEQNSVVAVIAARGGSKGLPGKNIKEFCGKPLIYWTLLAAQRCGYIDNIVVSTDSDEIASVVRQFGIDVPFFRPHALATDTATSAEVIIHSLDWCEQYQRKSYDYVILLEPTSPLRKDNDIDTALLKLHSHVSASAIVGICKSESQHPDFQVKISANGFLLPFNEQYNALRRQDLSESYFYEGSVYISRVSSFRQQKSFITPTTIGYEVEKWQSFEIDDMTDFVICEALMKMHLDSGIIHSDK